MPVATNGASAVNSINTNGAGGTPITFNYTCPAGTDCLVLVESASMNATATGLPTAISYNGVSLINVASSLAVDSTTPSQSSIWYLLAPPTGSSLVVSVNYPVGNGQINEQATCVQPLIGVNQSSPVGTAAIANGNSTAAAVVPTGAGANDLYLAVMNSQSGTSSSGGNQTLIRNTVQRGTCDQSLDSAIAGAGAFQWTVTTNFWVASAVAFLSASAGGGTATVAWIT